EPRGQFPMGAHGARAAARGVSSRTAMRCRREEAPGWSSRPGAQLPDRGKRPAFRSSWWETSGGDIQPRTPIATPVVTRKTPTYGGGMRQQRTSMAAAAALSLVLGLAGWAGAAEPDEPAPPASPGDSGSSAPGDSGSTSDESSA